MDLPDGTDMDTTNDTEIGTADDIDMDILNADIGQASQSMPTAETTARMQAVNTALQRLSETSLAHLVSASILSSAPRIHHSVSHHISPLNTHYTKLQNIVTKFYLFF